MQMQATRRLSAFAAGHRDQGSPRSASHGQWRGWANTPG